MKITENLTGGWSDSEISQDIYQAAEFAAKRVGANSNISSIKKCRTQIVSGKNYNIIFTLANGDDWNVTVYRNLKDEWSLTESTKLN